ncbi:MAG TPA: hypothetical protein ENN17_05610 [bacterium]|nr:hypothetical protein [bacterium]
MKTRLTFAFLFPAMVLFTGCNVQVNRSVHLGDGRTVRADQVTVNGQITVGSDCEVRGNLTTVNGNIRVGRNSKIRSIRTVNGTVRLQDDVKIYGKLQSVNGPVSCDPGVRIRGDIATVNGNIDLRQTMVGRNLVTTHGRITLAGKSEVDGNILIKRDQGSHRIRPLSIEITEGSVVRGDIRVADRRSVVTVSLSRGGQVQGVIHNATVVEE